ncbi:trimeric intracellular cation channel family protein [Bifidobacterium simiarum]|uniref:Glycine transporter domain-containing protein n=1 Tax=Bifidobacterium simiarum TaxID=2045441 RepID=A0A2M9HD59_9BIFI|nr:TRIC cation channel family protein [Bifidobacterium simiarum]MBT1166256.1 TRIC cation channel family protein [Bifidobacterium simiarum]PJM74743.1 hypothetical protein CSQ87_08410 [Bifidobacterium simiarum]
MEQVALESNAVFIGIEYLATFFCGLSGGLAAIHKRYDLFSILVLSWVTALGGGITRDLLLGALPPVGITDKGFVLTALVSGIIVAIVHPEIDHLKWSMITTDALALGLFAVNGTAKALAYHSSGMTAVFLGMFTALAGGTIRDILLNEVPSILRDKHLYAVPSFVGCLLTVFAARATDHWNLGLNGEMILDIVVVIVVFALRMLSVVFNITFPGAVERRQTHLPSQSRYLKRPIIHPETPDDHETDRETDEEEQTDADRQRA